MLVLGVSNDDKGSQLEELTKTILKSLGVTSITKNAIRSGGGELDVLGERELSGIAEPIKHRIFCECKAQKAPNNITDWYKFLGKLFVEEANSTGPVYAYFISLGGVNGNVAGHYQELRTRRTNVTL